MYPDFVEMSSSLSDEGAELVMNWRAVGHAEDLAGAAQTEPPGP